MVDTCLVENSFVDKLKPRIFATLHIWIFSLFISTPPNFSIVDVLVPFTNILHLAGLV